MMGIVQLCLQILTWLYVLLKGQTYCKSVLYLLIFCKCKYLNLYLGKVKSALGSWAREAAVHDCGGRSSYAVGLAARLLTGSYSVQSSIFAQIVGANCWYEPIVYLNCISDLML